jgi:hypothetical protein
MQLQLEPMNYWQDGSIRWIRINTTVKSDDDPLSFRNKNSPVRQFIERGLLNLSPTCNHSSNGALELSDWLPRLDSNQRQSGYT